MNQITRYILAALIGTVVGFLGGFQGIAGGFYITMFVLMTGLAATQRKAAGMALLAIIFPLSAGALYEYHKTGDVEVIPALIITFFYIIFATVGAKINSLFLEETVEYSLALLLGLTSIYFFQDAYKKSLKNK